MAVFESWFEQDIKKPVVPIKYPGMIFRSDSGANLIGVKVLDDGAPATLSGTVSAKILRPDGTTITQTGSRSGNQCMVTLPATAYAVSGELLLTLKLTDGDSTTTLLNVTMNVFP